MPWDEEPEYGWSIKYEVRVVYHMDTDKYHHVTETDFADKEEAEARFSQVQGKDKYFIEVEGFTPHVERVTLVEVRTKRAYDHLADYRKEHSDDS